MSDTNTQPEVDLEKVLRRIEKCLTLSKSPNEHEAAAALRQAQKLMAAYNVTESALVMNTIGQSDTLTDAYSRPPAWEMHLIALLRTAFGCDAIMHLGNSRTKAITTVVYIGVKHQAQLASYAHAVLRRQVNNARTKYTSSLPAHYSRGEKIASGETFCVGYISNIRKQVQELAINDATKAAINEVKTKALGGTGTQYKPSRSHSYAAAGAYSAGVEAGAGASLHRPMNGGAEQLKLA